jgi:hypothetical protein
MNITFLGAQDALIALSTLIGISVLFVIGILGASALVRRDKARNGSYAPVPASTVNAQTVPVQTPVFADTVPAHVAEHPTQLDRVSELVSR